MANLRVTNFGGIIPRLGKRLLPDSNAQYALNAKLFSGELRAWWQPTTLATLPDIEYEIPGDPPTPATTPPVDFYFFQYEGDDYYSGFRFKTDVVRAPLINDAFDRVYLSDETGAYITTLPDMAALNPPIALGVPAPVITAFTVTATGGTDALAETRVYVAILVSAYGEEGAPSGAVLESGNADGTWTIDDLDTFSYDSTLYPNITHLRLYRTITSSTGVDYRQVIEWDIGSVPNSYVDNVAATVVASSPVLQSLAWTPPPVGLQGIVAMAGGFMAGFVGKTIYFSEPYFPHAWPEEYQQAVEDDIVALGTFGNTLVATTVGQPYGAVGTVPAAMSFMKFEAMLPCMSSRGLVSTAASVLYPSPDGLVSISEGGIGIVSKNYVTKDEWESRFATSTMRAAVHGDRYFSFYSNSLGFIIGFDDAATAFTELQRDEGVIAVHNDRFTGRTLYLTSAGKVMEWDGNFGTAMTYTWRTKPFLVPKPLNFGAIQIRGTFNDAPNVETPVVVADVFGYDLNGITINTVPINGLVSGALVVDAPSSVVAKVYADDVLIWTGVFMSETPRRLPSGFKAVQWEIEVSGSVPLYSLVMASTMKELEQVL